MKKILVLFVIIYFVSVGRVVWCFDMQYSRQGLVILNNNEKIEGVICIKNKKKNLSTINVLPQGNKNFIKVKIKNILKIHFLYGNEKDFYNSVKSTDVWAYIYLKNGDIISMAYIDVLDILVVDNKNNAKTFIVYDGMDQIENINSVKEILFYPEEAMVSLNKKNSDDKYKVVKRTSYIRNAPNGKRIGKLYKNNKVKVINTKGNWEKVQFEAWVYKKNLK